MSEGASEVNEEGEGKAKRKVLSFADRIKIVDYLRSLVEPIVADSNAAVAALVSDATGVEVSWSALKYMIDELPDMKLSGKVYIKSMLSVEDQLQACYERDISFEAKLVFLEHQLAKLTDRVLHLEANAQP